MATNGVGGHRQAGNSDELAHLVDAARGGDIRARNSLFEELRTYLLWVANDQFDTKLKAKLGPSDIVQQSMMRAVEQFDSFRGTTTEEFKGWIRQIVINEAKMARRGLAAGKRDLRREAAVATPDIETSGATQPDPVDNQLTPRAFALAGEQAATVRQLIEQLPDNYRSVIQLRNWEELSFEEIGMRLGISTSGAAKTWYRALVELQKLYIQQDESRIH